MVEWAALGSQWGPFLAIVAGSLLAGWLFNRFVIGVVRAVAARTKTGIDDLVIRAIYPTLTFALFLLGVGLGLLRYRDVLPGGFVRSMGGLTLVVIVFLAALTLARVGSGILRHRAQQEPRWTPAANLGSRVLGAAVWIVAFLVVLDYYGVSITPLITSLGLAGLAIALALQDTLANFFAGIWIQTGKTLWPGHYVKIEEKNLEGFVVEVGWRTTKLRSLPGNVVVIPNAVLAQSTLTDFWLPEPKMGTNLQVVAGFEADPDKVVPMILEELRAAAKEVDYILEEPEPFCRLNRRVDNGWEFWMSFWVPFYYFQWNAQGYVLNKIRKRFLREGIRMPLPVAEQVEFRGDRAPSFASSIVGHESNGGSDGQVPDAAVPTSRAAQQAPTQD